METNNESTKVCHSCGRELPLYEFHKNCKSKDGLQSICKDCRKEFDKRRPNKHKLSKVYSNPDLAHYTPRQLIDELKCRGYRGTLTIQQSVIL